MKWWPLQYVVVECSSWRPTQPETSFWLMKEELNVYNMIAECAQLEASRGESQWPTHLSEARLLISVPNLARTSAFLPLLVSFDWSTFVFINPFTFSEHFYDSHLLECSSFQLPTCLMFWKFIFWSKTVFSHNLFNLHFLVNQSHIFTI